jgi:hypothetical protein
VASYQADYGTKQIPGSGKIARWEHDHDPGHPFRDRERFAHAFERFSKNPESVRFRFHGLKRSLSQSEAIHMTDVDFVDHVALAATFSTDPEQNAHWRGSIHRLRK